jgi:O-methyltransferase involved in polyketide biosynthesis
VDIPEAIEICERFLTPGKRCRYLRLSAFDPSWIDEVDASRGVVTAQGLFMYFNEAQIRPFTPFKKSCSGSCPGVYPNPE